MFDPRVEKFAQTICQALEIVEDDVVLVLSTEGASALVLEIQKEIFKRGAYPMIRLTLEQMRYNFYKYAKDKNLTRFPPGLAREIELATKFISIESHYNPNQMKKVDPNKMALWKQTAEPYDRQLGFIPAVVTIFPNVRYANEAGMNLEEYEKFFYDAVSIDHDQLYEKYHTVEEMLSSGKHFQIKTSNTDLSFAMEGRNFTLHSLLINFPDGEIFCSPLEKSVQGYIRFEHPQTCLGKTFRKLYLKFQDGEVVDFDCEADKSELDKLLHLDDGARRLGEFGFGINPALHDLTNDILFDEKVEGTIHIALGEGFVEVGGTNQSMIHFDMVKDMRGEGLVIMDGRVIYREGVFLPL